MLFVGTLLGILFYYPVNIYVFVQTVIKGWKKVNLKAVRSVQKKLMVLSRYFGANVLVGLKKLSFSIFHYIYIGEIIVFLHEK